MSVPRNEFKESLEAANDTQLYDVELIQGIIKSLDFLRSEAKKSGSEEVQVMINSAFSMVLITHYHFLRHGALLDIREFPQKGN